MRRAAALLAVICISLWAAEPRRSPVPMPAPLQDKNFYLLSLMQRTPEVRELIRNDAGLAALANQMRSRLQRAADCADIECFGTAMEWRLSESEAAAGALRALYVSSPAMARMVDGELRSSGQYEMHNGLDGQEFLVRTWSDTIRAMNNVIEVYGTGKAPRNPEIDSIAFDVKAAALPRLLKNIVMVLNDDPGGLELFFEPSLRFAMELLEANHRDEAARFEPLEQGENAAAIRAIGSIDWAKYPYSAIIVPGAGPDRPEWALSPMGKLRLELAVRRYREHKAPFLLVSGGMVHPVKTQYAEAIEMKRRLMADFGIPEQAILVDPHARHTTTNLRNAARLIYRYGIPFTRKALIVTDAAQSSGIESTDFAARCLREIRLMPGTIGARLSLFELEFLPSVISLQVDPLDPLDP